jgi:hypothetical protein
VDVWFYMMDATNVRVREKKKKEKKKRCGKERVGA